MKFFLGEELRTIQVKDSDEVNQLLERFRGAPPLLQGSVSPQLHSILECIHRDPFQPDLSVRMIRDRCRLRDHNISSRFRHTFGTTIKGYIEAIRMRAACELLTTRAVSVFDVALYVGYTHPQTFYRVFQRHLGCSPAVYREMQRKREVTR